jgi:hypothetical protein
MSASTHSRLLAPLLALLLAVGLGALLLGGDGPSPEAEAAAMAAASPIPSAASVGAGSADVSAELSEPPAATGAVELDPTAPSSPAPEPVELAAASRLDDPAEAPLPAQIPGRLLVVVKDTEGQPIEGAWVALSATREPGKAEIGDLVSRPAWKAGQHASTDGSGRAIVPLPLGAAKVTAYAKFGAREGVSETVEVSRWVVEVVVRPLDPPPPGLGALFLRFQAGRQRLGLAPVEVALVRRSITLSGLYGGEELGRAVLQGSTDADGLFAIGRLPTGAYAITTFSPGWADVQASVVVEAALTSLDLDLAEPGRDVAGPLVPPPGIGPGAVRVRVLTPVGDYPATVEPTSTPAPGGGQGYRWRALRLPPGDHLVVGEIAGHAPRCEQVAVDGATTLETGPTISWAWSGTVRGRVVNQAREPRKGEQVVLARDEPVSAIARPRPPFVNRVDKPGRPRATAELRDQRDVVAFGLGLATTTDADGRFLLRGLAPDAYVLYVGKLEQPLGVSGELDLGELLVPDEPEEGEVIMALVGNVTAEARLASARVTHPRGRIEVGASGAFTLEVRGKEGSTIVLEAEGTDLDGHLLFSGEPRAVTVRAGSVIVDLPLLAAARLHGRLLLPPALGGRESVVVVRGAAPPRDDDGGPRPEAFVRRPGVGADGSWGLAEVPARRALLVEVPGVSRTVVTLEPGEEKHLEEDLSDRVQLLPIVVRNLLDARAHVTALVTCEAERRDGELVPPAVARAPLHGGVGVVPGLRAGRAAVEVEVEEPTSGTFWRVRRDVDLRPGMAAFEVDLPHARGLIVGQIPRPWPRLVRARSSYGQVDVAEVMTDLEGRFQLDVPAGGWILEDDTWRPVNVEVPVGVEVEVELQGR